MVHCRCGWFRALLLIAVLGAGVSLRAADPPRRRGGFFRPPGAAEPAKAEDEKALLQKAAALSDDAVRAAIRKGADSLLDEVNKEITTLKESPGPGQRRGPGGMLIATVSDRSAGAICLGTYALLMAGRVTGDPRLHFTSKEMSPAIDFIVALQSHYTYTLGLQASALSLLPNRPDFRKALTAVRNELLTGQINAAFTYQTTPDTRRNGFRDNSNTQYGQLGIWACQDAGLEIPTHFWEMVDAHWRNSQLADGGWSYISTFNEGPAPAWRQGATATMTAAGVASLFLSQDELDRTVSYNPRPDKALDAGIQWLSAHFEEYRNTLPDDLYLAYGIERVALSGGLKTLGTHDWFREGAVLLIDNQAADGSWTYSMGGDCCGTAYALLFLSRGIAPVACGKLQYPGPWNARARDCARFVHWLSKRTEQTLNWQNLSIDSDPDDWNVPVLVITGHDDPKFTPEQIAHLRRYVENGGLIFSSADEGNAAFTKAIRLKYAPAIFDGTYEMHALPADHPAFTLTFKIPKLRQPHLFGLSNGVREVWIHSADDITAAWQAYTTAKTQSFEVPANLYFYALGRAPHAIHLAPLTPPPAPPPTMTLSIARLVYAGNWDPEPAAWGRFAQALRQTHGADLRLVPVKIADLDAAKTPIAHITGTTAFVPTQEQRKKLTDFVAHGGVLLADAVGGADAFAKSFQAAVEEMFPPHSLREIPPDSVIFSGNLPGGEAIKSIDTRLFTDMPESRKRPVALMQVLQNGRPVLVFSQGDLTAGLGGFRTWGILGYTPEATRAITWNALMYLDPPKLAVTPAAATQPATAPAAGGTPASAAVP